MALLAARGASVAHCPLSNGYFAGGALPVRGLLAAGVAVGLGTDVAGGYDPGAALVLPSSYFSRGKKYGGI